MLTGCAIMVRMTTDGSHDWSLTYPKEPDNVLAGASDPSGKKTPDPSEAREVFPVSFDKDFLDFRPEEVSEEEIAPKGWSALERASEPTFEESLIPSPEPESESPDSPETTSENQTIAQPPVGMDS